jgi:cytochrome c553
LTKSGDLADCTAGPCALPAQRSDCNDSTGAISADPIAATPGSLPCRIRDAFPFCEDRNVKSLYQRRPGFWMTLSVAALMITGCVLAASFCGKAEAGPLGPWGWLHRHHHHDDDPGPNVDDVGGEWHWIRSPEEEKIVASALFNRYCIRCHGQDGRGVWDIPGIPNFTNAYWQGTRTEAMLARRIIEGRGAIMPPFRGVLSLEEAWAMARYLRTLIPRTDESQPELPEPKKAADTPKK